MFEHSLLQSRPTARRAPLLAFAVATHLVVLGAVVVASAWGVAAVEPPPDQLDPLIVVFEPPAPPPPPPPPPAPAAESVREQVPELEPAEVVQPTVVRDLAPQPPPSAAPLAGGEPGGEEGGQVGGVVGGDPIHRVLGGSLEHGVPGGTGDTPGGTGTAAELPIPVGGQVAAPVALVRVEPHYTEAARRVRLEGTVVVEAIVDRSGRVTDARVLKPLGMGLDASAVEAVRQWRFRPATLHGRPVAVFFRLTVTFRLN
jgi:protein TonB